MRILRQPAALAILAAGNFAAMLAINSFLFRPLAHGLQTLDPRPLGFSQEEASAWLTALGAPGRETVLVWHYLTFDLVFPALFTLAVASAILWVGRQLPGFRPMPMRTQELVALAVPLPYALADYGQNLLVMRMLAAPTEAGHLLVSVASALVMAKFVFGAIALGVLAALFMASRRRV